jgi:rfaE bifunctional protein kinase chain/domain
MQIKIYSAEDMPAQPDSVGLAFGHFDLVHPGHVRYLLNAKARFLVLVVAVLPDKRAEEGVQYLHKQSERARAVAELACVDYVVPLEHASLCDTVKKIKPTALILGEEYKQIASPDVKAAIHEQRRSDREVLFSSGGDEASTVLISRFEDEIESERIDQFNKVLCRNNIDRHTLLSLIDDWQNARVLVVGDSIVDRYIDCEAVGLSAEAPVVVVREKREQFFAGGAAVVAAHIAQLGGMCTLVSVVGEDPQGGILFSALETLGFDHCLVSDPDRPTTLKTRYIVESQKLFRTSRLSDQEISKTVENRLIEELKVRTSEIDVVVISDFNYGVITRKILKILKSLSKKNKFRIIGDLQCSSQFGSILKFNDFSLLCPNEKEARIALHDKVSGLEKISQQLIAKTKPAYLVLKLGSEGFILYDATSPLSIKREAFPALSVAPIDVAGAGDSMLAVFALALARQQPLIYAGALATCMAAEAVETLGNSPVSAERVRKRLTQIAFL